MKKTVIGILAHVDAGKTTLSEAMLYLSGGIRKLGRVDNGDAFLDTDALERARGITIFSKQAVFKFGSTRFTLLDTPGHVDFSAEMERTLQALDYAVLVISGSDGVQGHTLTLWRLLKEYEIPVFLFINKMDQPGCSREKLLQELQERLDEACADFGVSDQEAFQEAAAMCGEAALEQYLETGRVSDEKIREMIFSRKMFPCCFGSALRLEGVEEFLKALDFWTRPVSYPEEFGARVFKVARDVQGNRLTYLKVTGGVLKARMQLGDEKVNQIRIYSGEKYETVNEAAAGTVCAVTGPGDTRPGQGFGAEETAGLPVLEPVLTYQICLPEGCEPAAMLPKLRQLEEEEPELHIVWNEQLKEIHAQVMGEVQIEILKSLILERFETEVEFGAGNIVYKETVARTVEGVGHFEPLRHYAEVHLLLEPLERGSGLEFASACSEDSLDRNWQRLVLTHLAEKEHPGVLIGAPVTDMRITLAAGRAHLKHTEGGDFRQATYRAVRQGLREAGTVLLEPYYEFRLEIPAQMVGRAMTDMEKMSGECLPPELSEDIAVLKGKVPVASARDYQKEVTAYTRGTGRLVCVPAGYGPCHNAQEVIEAAGYDPERDLENPTGSVFCSHGAGYPVSWDKVKEHMHVESPFSCLKNSAAGNAAESTGSGEGEPWLGVEEIDAILARTYYANSHGKAPGRKRAGSRRTVISAPAGQRQPKPAAIRKKYLLVDGYNIIFAWEELRSLAKANIDGARGKLLDILCNYQAVRKCRLIAVFDAYRVQGHRTEAMDYHNIQVVYTREAETADQYIEKFAHENGMKYDVTVATSDGLEQIIIRSQGCRLLSAREFQEEVERAALEIRQIYEEKQGPGRRNFLLDTLPEEARRQIEKLAGEASRNETSD